MQSLDELEKTLLQLQKQITDDHQKIKELQKVVLELYEHAYGQYRNKDGSRT